MPSALPNLSGGIAKLKAKTKIQVLFKKDFHTSDYLYADDASRNAPGAQATTTTREGFVRDADYENEERMLAAMEKIEMASTNDGPMAIVPDEFWASLKRFISQTVIAKRQNEKELAKKVAKLRNYNELENLERRIAELQSHRIELVRELAQEEKAFADSFRLKSKVSQVLEQTSQWASATKEVFNHIFEEKKAADMLRLGLDWIKKHSESAEATSEMREKVARNVAESFVEGRVVYRTSRVLDKRYCVITIYTHDQRSTDFSDEMPYAKPTFSSSVWQGEENEAGHEGMAVLMKTLMTEELPGGAGGRQTSLPVYLIVIYDVMLRAYYMLEHQPKDLGHRLHTEEGVIKHVNAYLTIARGDDGFFVPKMAGTRAPMRQVWSGKREIEGDRPGLFHISIFELDIKTWLMRVHDNSLCKLYTHVVPKDLLNDHEDLADADDKEDGVTDPIRVSVALERLRFDGCVLSIQKSTRQSAVDVVDTMSKKSSMKELQTLHASTLWPNELVVNTASRLGMESKYMLVRLSSSPTQNMMGIIVYEPISQTLFEQIFCFSDVCQKQAEYESQKGDRKGLASLFRTMAKRAALNVHRSAAKKRGQKVSPELDNRTDTDSRAVSDASGSNAEPDEARSDSAVVADLADAGLTAMRKLRIRRACRTALLSAKVQKSAEPHNRLTLFGVEGTDYTRAVSELLEGVQLTEENKLLFRFEQPWTSVRDLAYPKNQIKLESEGRETDSETPASED
eukprot:GEMP01010806.1.p1 GENE.GEMP01010806.1~~GEMP01010806.1.p1  ORF type:complete len:740 (+),score=191.99 GEMP01010806.1:62-2281(+)